MVTQRAEAEEYSAWMYMHGLTDEDIWTYGIGDAGSGEGYRLAQIKTDKVRYMEGTYGCTYYQISIGDSDNDNVLSRSGADTPIGEDLFRWLTYICTRAVDNGQPVFDSRRHGSDARNVEPRVIAEQVRVRRDENKTKELTFDEYLKQEKMLVPRKMDDGVEISTLAGDGATVIINDNDRLNRNISNARKEYLSSLDTGKREKKRKANVALRSSEPGEIMDTEVIDRNEIATDWERMHNITRADMDVIQGYRDNSIRKKSEEMKKVEESRIELEKKRNADKIQTAEEVEADIEERKGVSVDEYFMLREDMTDEGEVITGVENKYILPERLYIKRIAGDGMCATRAITDDDLGGTTACIDLLDNYGVEQSRRSVWRSSDYIYGDAILRGYRALIVEEYTNPVSREVTTTVKVMNANKDNKGKVKMFRQTNNHFDRLYDYSRNGETLVYVPPDRVNLQRPGIGILEVPYGMGRMLMDKLGDEYKFEVGELDKDEQVDVVIKKKKDRQSSSRSH
jgi:hypothetical protein